MVDHTEEVAAEPTAWFGAFLLTWVSAAVASTVMLLVAGATDPDTPTSIPVLAVSLAAGWAVYTAGSVVAARRLGRSGPLAELGISARPIDLIGVPIGVIGQLLLIPAVYLPLRAIWPATFDEGALTETAEDLIDRADGGLFVVLFVLVVIGAPVFEELFYRGLLQRPLLARYSPVVVIVGVAAVFALIHFRPVEYPGLFVAGLLFGVCAWRTDRLGMAVAAHVGFNATGLVLAL
ncbi:MAG: lysostaphin resistance A-like protein [Ilumatobacter sp.]